MPTAFLFPGQGSQHVGMAADLFQAYPAARTLLESANDILQFDLTSIMFGNEDDKSDADRLKQTHVTQPALYAHSAAVMQLLRAANRSPDAVAGHSLGEYSALAAADAVSFEDGLRVVAVRGRAMADAGTARPGAMAAVLGMENEDVQLLCEEASENDDVVQPANYNTPGQVVISGDVDAVSQASELAMGRGARRVIPLPVSGAFHSPLMEEARESLAEALADLTVNEPRCPVYLNVSGEVTRNPQTIKRALLNQLTSPVKWAQSLQAMQRDGIDHFLEVGPGNVLSGLAKRTLGRDIETSTAGTTDEVRSLTAEST